MNPGVFVFDADGVVCTGGSFTAHLEREHGIAPPGFAEFFRGPFRDCIVGRGDLRTDIAPILPALGWHRGVAAFLEFWFTREHVVDERVMTCVAALRARGFPCFLGTNQERHRLAYMREAMGFNRQFDGILASCELGAAKPEREYFERVTDRLGRRPEEIALIDDAEKNVAAARAFGWQAVHYSSFADMEAWLAAVGGVRVVV